MSIFDKTTASLLRPDKEWYLDHAASGDRYRRWSELSRDEMLAYTDGRWEVRLGSANGVTVANGREMTCEQAKHRAVMVYVALLLPCVQGEGESHGGR